MVRLDIIEEYIMVETWFSHGGWEVGRKKERRKECRKEGRKEGNGVPKSPYRPPPDDLTSSH
jgi:hypothetical protein